MSPRLTTGPALKLSPRRAAAYWRRSSRLLSPVEANTPALKALVKGLRGATTPEDLKLAPGLAENLATAVARQHFTDHPTHYPYVDNATYAGREAARLKGVLDTPSGAAWLLP